jgi:hypothetical protein
MWRKGISIAVLLGLLAVFVTQPTLAQNPVWTAQYYNTATLFGDPTVTRTDANIAFNWGMLRQLRGKLIILGALGTDVFLNAEPIASLRWQMTRLRHLQLWLPVINTFDNPAVGQTVALM